MCCRWKQSALCGAAFVLENEIETKGKGDRGKRGGGGREKGEGRREKGEGRRESKGDVSAGKWGCRWRGVRGGGLDATPSSVKTGKPWTKGGKRSTLQHVRVRSRNCCDSKSFTNLGSRYSPPSIWPYKESVSAFSSPPRAILAQ